MKKWKDNLSSWNEELALSKWPLFEIFAFYWIYTFTFFISPWFSFWFLSLSFNNLSFLLPLNVCIIPILNFIWDMEIKSSMCLWLGFRDFILSLWCYINLSSKDAILYVSIYILNIYSSTLQSRTKFTFSAGCAMIIFCFTWSFCPCQLPQLLMPVFAAGMWGK